MFYPFRLWGEQDGFPGSNNGGRGLEEEQGDLGEFVAKFLGMGFPGGPVIDKLSRDGDRRRFNFPRPMMRSKTFDFSFSGLKTSVINMFKDSLATGAELPLSDIAASFQMAVVDVLVQKGLRAALDNQVRTILLAGGVAANQMLRSTLQAQAAKHQISLVLPSPRLCTDNAAMVAAAGSFRLAAGEHAGLDLNADPRLVLNNVGTTQPTQTRQQAL